MKPSDTNPPVKPAPSDPPEPTGAVPKQTRQREKTVTLLLAIVADEENGLMVFVHNDDDEPREFKDARDAMRWVKDNGGMGSFYPPKAAIA